MSCLTNTARLFLISKGVYKKKWWLQIVVLVLLCIMSSTNLASAEGVAATEVSLESWARTYDGPAKSVDEATAITVDALGYVYVTGHSNGFNSDGINSDYATIKYDSKGTRQWIRRYNGSAKSADSPTAITTDKDGNVFVTGTSYSNSCDVPNCVRFATIKYNKDGFLAWVREYGKDSVVSAMTIDLDGNIYVTGVTNDQANEYYATVKYDKDGNELWARKYDYLPAAAIAYNDDTPSSITTDAAGNVYVTGTSMGISSWYDYATVKYDHNGKQLWARRYNGLANHTDRSRAIAVDKVGNVYITGQSDGYAGRADIVTIKYDTNGNKLWVKRYNSPSNSDDAALSIVLDGNNNAFVLGASSTGSVCTLIKYDSDGNEIWVNRYNSFYPNAMALGPDNAIYVTGFYLEAYRSSYYCLTVKYDVNGNRIWEGQYHGKSNMCSASSVAIDSIGNVYISGFRRPSSDTSTSDYLTAKFSVWNFPVLPYNPGSYNGRSFFYDNNHLGEDETLPEKTPIRAIGPGVIKKYGPASGYGELVVVVEHDLGKTYEFTNAYGDVVSTRYILSIYGHLRPSQERDGVVTGLKVGNHVTSDTVLGYVNDNAHNGDGAEHLHIGIRLSNAATAKAKDQTWFRGYEGATHFGEDFAAASKVIDILK
jgi:hypothetical protein